MLLTVDLIQFINDGRTDIIWRLDVHCRDTSQRRRIVADFAVSNKRVRCIDRLAELALRLLMGHNGSGGGGGRGCEWWTLRRGLLVTLLLYWI